jgi:nucleosome binding factor SPN SPT16 subunit
METAAVPARGAILDKKLRNEKQNQDKQSNEMKRRAHQKQLAEARQNEGLKKFSGKTDGVDKEEKAVFRKFEAYRKDANLPKQIADLRVLKTNS